MIDKYGNPLRPTALDISYIAEGDEEEDEDIDNQGLSQKSKNSSDTIPPYTSMKLKLKPKIKALSPSKIATVSVFDFVNKNEVEFFESNVMHSSRAVLNTSKSPGDADTTDPTHHGIYKEESKTFLYINPTNHTNKATSPKMKKMNTHNNHNNDLNTENNSESNSSKNSKISSLLTGTTQTKITAQSIILPLPLDYKLSAFKAPLGSGFSGPRSTPITDQISTTRILPTINVIKALPPISSIPFVPITNQSQSSISSSSSSSSDVPSVAIFGKIPQLLNLKNIAPTIINNDNDNIYNNNNHNNNYDHLNNNNSSDINSNNNSRDNGSSEISHSTRSHCRSYDSIGHTIPPLSLPAPLHTAHNYQNQHTFNTTTNLRANLQKDPSSHTVGSGHISTPGLSESVKSDIPNSMLGDRNNDNDNDNDNGEGYHYNVCGQNNNSYLSYNSKNITGNRYDRYNSSNDSNYGNSMKSNDYDANSVGPSLTGNMLDVEAVGHVKPKPVTPKLNSSNSPRISPKLPHGYTNEITGEGITWSMILNDNDGEGEGRGGGVRDKREGGDGFLGGRLGGTGTGTGYALGSAWGSQSTGLRAGRDDLDMGFAPISSRGTTLKGVNLNLMDPGPLIPREIKIKYTEKDRNRGAFGGGSGGVGRMKKSRGNIHCVDLERSSVDFNCSGNIPSEHWSDSDEGSIVNTIPPETPDLSPLLSGRKGPLPATRSRFSPTGRGDKQKSIDLLCLDNYFDD